MDFRFTVLTVSITYGNLNDLEVHFAGTEQQVEVAERIEVAKVGAVPDQRQIIFPEHHLGAAQRVLQAFAEQPGKGHGEEFVRDQVERAHRLAFHRVDQPASVQELGLSTDDGAVELRQILGRYREIGVEDHQYVTCGLQETFAHGISLAGMVLYQQLDVAVGVVGLHTSYFFRRAVSRMSVDEYDFLVCPEARKALNGRFDVAFFIAARNDDGNRQIILRVSRRGTGHGEE